MRMARNTTPVHPFVRRQGRFWFAPSIRLSLGIPSSRLSSATIIFLTLMLYSGGYVIRLMSHYCIDQILNTGSFAVHGPVYPGYFVYLRSGRCIPGSFYAFALLDNYFHFVRLPAGENKRLASCRLFTLGRDLLIHFPKRTCVLTGDNCFTTLCTARVSLTVVYQ